MKELNKELSYTNKSSLFTILILSGFISVIGLFLCVFNRILSIHKNTSIKLAGGKIDIDDGRIKANLLDYFQLEDMLVQILVPLLLVTIFFVLQKWKFREFIGLNNFNIRKNLLYTLGSVIVLTLCGALIENDQNEGISFMNRMIEDNSMISLLLIVGILIPISEEIIFRKIIYDLGNMILSKYAPFVGLSLSFILFFILHSQYSGGAMIYIAVLSFILSFGRYYTGGIIIPIIIHMINNTLPILYIN